MDPLASTDPERIDEYTLEGRLGAGGYGVVYAATDAEGRRVALKVLRPELADNPGLKERLAREGKALGRVGGDRNVEIYKVVTEGTQSLRPGSEVTIAGETASNAAPTTAADKS